MASYTGTITNGSGNYANQNLLEFIRNTLVAEGWTQMRFDVSGQTRELIVKGVGYSGSEEIYIGFRSYQDTTADYYNISVACFTGYVSGNSFTTQPGYTESGVPSHNLSITYWINVSPQRVVLALKVGTPVYETAYVGKIFPYATPSQYPYPIVCFGMLNALAATRYSDTSHSMPFKGNKVNAKLRSTSGTMLQPYVWPFNADIINSPSTGSAQGQERDMGGYYSLNPLILMEPSNNVFGELEGVYHISGFNNVVENTLTISGKNYIVIQDTYRTSFGDYVAIEI